MPLLMLVVALSQAPPSGEALGQQLTAELLSQDTTALWARLGPSARRVFKSESGLKAFAKKVQNDFGDEVRMTSEKVSQRGSLIAYTRLGVFSRYALGVEIEWQWDGEGLVVSLSVQPAFREAPTKYAEYHPRTSLHFPLEGQWFVLWGGRSWEENRHSAVPDMRFAYDLVIYRGANTCNTPCTLNEQYFAWNKVVRAPAGGTVAVVENSIADNLPNQPSTKTLFGNYVVIDHGNGEFSLLGHLKKGSVAVKKGESVDAGQLIGRVGSSGVSTEPHLHYQLMDAADWKAAHGMPVELVDYLSDGKKVARGEPKRGQLLAP